MALDVTVLRVFTDANGDFGNPLGVLDASHAEPADRQRIAAELGYSETIFVDLPQPGSRTATAHIFTPTVELPFAGHPTVGASWWLKDRGTPIDVLTVTAGVVRVGYEERSDGHVTVIRAKADWAPDFSIHELASVEDVLVTDPNGYGDDAAHFVWAWIDHSAGSIRARVFVSSLGVPEDEATGAAAVRITDHLGRDLAITQGKGSQIQTTWHADGWLTIAGRVVDDGIRSLE